MPGQDDPIKRLRAALGLNQKPFGDLFGVSQNRVSDWERGAPLSPENADQVWKRYGTRLRGMGCRFQDLLRRRGPTASDGDGAGAAA
jgi:hypothetical protein